MKKYDDHALKTIPIKILNGYIELACSLQSSVSVQNLNWSSATLGGFVTLETMDTLTETDPRNKWIEKKVYTHVPPRSQTNSPTHQCWAKLWYLKTTQAPLNYFSNHYLGYDAILDQISIYHTAIPPYPPPPSALPIQCPDCQALQNSAISLNTEKRTLEANIARFESYQNTLDPDEGAKYSATIKKIRSKIGQIDKSLSMSPASGKIFCTSGYRVDTHPVPGYSYGVTLDWGLVEVIPERTGDNTVSFSIKVYNYIPNFSASI